MNKNPLTDTELVSLLENELKQLELSISYNMPKNRIQEVIRRLRFIIKDRRIPK